MRSVLLPVFTSFCLLLGIEQSLFAQDDRSQTGELNIEQDEVRKNPYRESQDATIEYFKQLSEQTKKLAAGSVSKVEPLGDNMLFHLTGVYLYCAVNSGTCPLVLESILEVDVINSRIEGKASCPNMKRFWNNWVRNGMEERHKYLVKTSFINEHTKFVGQERPKFLKCEGTVQGVISGIASNEAFFRDRYRAGSPQAGMAAKLTRVLEQLKEKVPNVFVATGAQDASGQSKEDAKGKTKAKTNAPARKSPLMGR